MRRLPLLLAALISLVFCLGTGPSGSQVVAESPEARWSAPGHDAIRLLHERFERLDRDLRGHLVRLRRTGVAGRTPEAQQPHDAENFRQDLAVLELAVHRRGKEVFERFRLKLHELRNLVANLERAVTAVAPPAALPSYERRSYDRVSRITADPTASPSNDHCANAPLIGDGTRDGITTAATNDGQASCGSSMFAPDVWFRYVATNSGFVSADTFGSAYDTVLSVHSACPGTSDNQLSCNDDAFGLQSAVSFYAEKGEEFRIRVSGFNQAVGSFLLTLGPRGCISGTVTDATTGDPIYDGRVEAYNSSGYYERSTTPEPSGDYTIPWLAAGTYTITTASFDGHIDELYDDIPCPGGYYECAHINGTPVVVTTNTMTSDIDFALDEGGVISGLVTHTATEEPVPDVLVEIFNSGRDRESYDYTDAGGRYSAGGLPSGTYYAATDSSVVANELYDNIPCPGGAFSGCYPPTGTSIAVTVNATTSGIDFVLDRLGAITGTVTDASTGDPIDLIRVAIHDADGDYVKGDYTDASGTYTVAGLAAGTYFAVAQSNYFVDELYDDIPCPGGSGYECDQTIGKPIAVSINATTSGIDFALDRLGVIKGTVTAAATGDPISNVSIEVWISSGSFLRSAFTDTFGAYIVEGLSAGTYFMVTDDYGEYADEIYEEIPCPRGPYYCEPPNGTPVPVNIGVTTMGIDFTLDRFAAISGTVTDSATFDPLESASVRIWNATGSMFGYGSTDASGYYEVKGLDSGTYYVTAAHRVLSYAGELYDDLPCPGGTTWGCDPATGKAITASLNTTTSGVDFALNPGGAISGRLTEAGTGDAIGNEDVEIWAATGSFVARDVTDFAGHYEMNGLAPGTYFATTNSSQYLDELYEDLPCPGGAPEGCAPTMGTPISVIAGVTTSGIDFVLGSKGVISGTVTDATSGEPISTRVIIWKEAGSFAGVDNTDSSGHYTVHGIGPGTYFATTDSDLYLNKLYENLPCHPDCDPTTGSPIVVTLGAETVGIDFQLDGPGAISGVVTDAAGGKPLSGVAVRAWNGNGAAVGRDYTNIAGVFTFEALAAGTYFLTTDNDHGFLDELYDDLPCLGGAFSVGCIVTKGTPVEVTSSTTTRHVNFALQYITSGIAGRVTDGSGIPLSSVFVDAWDDDGDLVASTVSGAQGIYFLTLSAGTYFISTDNGLGLDDEVYDDLICPAGSFAAGLCDLTSGTPVIVLNLAGQMTTGIDFVLESLSVFGDGFEFGDLSAWSSAVGGP